MSKYEIHVVRGNGGPPSGELLGRLETDDFQGAVNLLDYSFGKYGEPVEVYAGVFVLCPLHDVGSRVLVTETSAFYGVLVSEETYDGWWDKAGEMAL